MLLSNAKVTNFKSIIDSSDVPIDADITVLVGQNESGKSAFLQALYQAYPIFGIDKGFSITDDYPRRNIQKLKRDDKREDKVVITLTYILNTNDIEEINKLLGVKVINKASFKFQEEYSGNAILIGMDTLLDETLYIQHLLKGIEFPANLAPAITSITSVKKLIFFLKGKDLPDKASELRSNLEKRFGASTWENLPAWEVYTNYLRDKRPRFFYFDEYRLLPGKTNLRHLQKRLIESNNETNPIPITSEEQATLALLEMADISLEDLLKDTSYEEARTNLEGVSNDITDQVLKFWLQNTNIEVILDIHDDSKDTAPFNDGPNLYIHIRNKLHRVAVPFDQRSKGFIWFFSFLVWFNSVHNRAKDKNGNSNPIILLLDEPGLNLHALAQNNLLSYIDSLSESYQVIYSTHSPFMVRNERLEQVRVVEDKEPDGTKISDRLDGSDPRTLFPLQAALGYTIAQNLFISKRNLVVEGISDLAYLQFFSQICEVAGKESLRPDITIMPVGGIDKISTFVALLGANKLELVILHDYDGKPDAKLDSLIREKILQEKYLLSYAIYRNPTGKKPTKTEQAAFTATDIEDLFTIDLYLKLFSETFKKELAGKLLIEADLPQGIRIVERLDRWLKANNVQTRPSGSFNHYAPVKALVANTLVIDEDTIAKFSCMFQDINKLFTK